MGLISKYLRSTEGGLVFWCQGCKDTHPLWIKGKVPEGQSPSWTWNGDVDKPVFVPSVLVTSGHYSKYWKEGQNCWCTYNKEQREQGLPEAKFQCNRCHSFIGCNGAEPGQIIFLSDSTHEHAGKVLPLAEFPKDKDSL